MENEIGDVEQEYRDKASGLLAAYPEHMHAEVLADVLMQVENQRGRANGVLALPLLEKLELDRDVRASRLTEIVEQEKALAAEKEQLQLEVHTLNQAIKKLRDAVPQAAP